MTPQVRTLRHLLCCLLLGLVASGGPAGCVNLGKRDSVQEWPRRPWSEAFVFTTPHYIVRTNTSVEVAMYIGQLMEKIFAEYRAMLGCCDASVRGLTINAYARRKEYNAVARRLGLSSGMTSGLYSPVPPAAIHIPYIPDLRTYPRVTLLHEGLHQFIDQAAGFRVPPAARSMLPLSRHTLVGVPLWLNEGLATYMESGVITGNGIEIGRINRSRLVHLQKMIRKGRCPALRKVLGRPYGGPFTAGDYAVAWGIVYTLRHAPRAAVQEDRRTRLKQYLVECRRAFYADPLTEFLHDFLPHGRPVKDFDRIWAEYIARRSLKTFERIIVGQGATLDSWERDWAEHILRLDPSASYGGLCYQQQ